MSKRAGMLLVLYIQCVDLRLLVHTEVGSIEGLQADDGDYVMFLGIPYARVNSSNPFGASLPVPKFKKVFQAFDDSVICPQIVEIYNVYDGSLDCLRLNIYVPNTNTKNRAILIYFHGGQNRFGSGNKILYGPKYLIRHDIIIVSFNYRLGPYGFLCDHTPEIPGNQGIKDQYTAMKWVKDNIQAFGGDPDRITIAGHSSGAMSVDTHLLTKQPRLYQQAVIQSGTATTSLFILPPKRIKVVDIADKLGFKTTDMSAAILFLAKTSPEIVINATHFYEWAVCIEEKFEGVFGYVFEAPEDAKASNVDGIDILGGYTNTEGLCSLYGNSNIHSIDRPDIFHHVLSTVFNFPNDSIAKIVQHFYLGDGEINYLNKYKIIDFLSDFDYVYPVQHALNRYKKHNNTKVYQYFFTYDGKENRYKKAYNVTEPGATHADELGYIFTKGEKQDRQEPNPEDKIMIDIMSTLWTNFVKYGNPTPTTTELIPLVWPPISDKVQCLQIDKNLEIITRPFHANLAFWDLFYEAYRDRLKIASAKTSSANILCCSNFFMLTLYLFRF